MDIQLGLPTFVCGAATAAVVLLRCGRLADRPAVLGTSPGECCRWWPGCSCWCRRCSRPGSFSDLADLLRRIGAAQRQRGGLGAGSLLALACNLMNNLPAGLIAGHAMQSAQAPPIVAGAVLVGIDLGPNLSVTGSLATILWLDRIAARGAALQRLGLPEGGRSGNAAGAAAGIGGAVRGRLNRSLQEVALRLVWLHPLLPAAGVALIATT